MNQNKYQLKILTDWQQAEELSDAWCALLTRCRENHIFNTYLWHKIWWRNFGAGKILYLVAVFKEAKLVGLAPLVRAKKTIKFVGDPNADYHDFIIDQDEAREEIFALIFEHLVNLSQNKKIIIFLNEVNEKSLTYQEFQKVAYPYQRQEVSNLSFQLNFFPIEAGNLKDKIEKRDTKQKLKKLMSKGRVSYLLVSEIEDLEEKMEKFFAFYQKRAFRKGYLRFFNRESYKKFFIDLTKELLKENMLKLWFLNFNDKLIALDLNFFYQGVYYRYLPAFDQGFAQYSPGSILLERVMKDAHQVAKSYDFLRGAEIYKKRYTNRESKNYWLIIYPNKLLYLTGRFWSVLKLRLKKIKALVVYYHYFKTLVM